MPDTIARDAFPRDWDDALARLPDADPPVDGWARLQARLPPVPRRRHRWRLPTAIAASLALACWLPMQFAEHGPYLHGRASSSAAPSVQAEAIAMPPLLADARQLAGPVVPPDISMPVRANMPHVVPSHARDVAAGTPTPPTSTDLEPLYAESARLESVLRQLQDDRVASAPVAALSDDWNARLAHIDAALSDPQLGHDERRQLWQQRVANLRQLAGLEGTQRWLSANGTPEPILATVL